MEKPTLSDRFEKISEGGNAEFRFKEIENPEHPCDDVCAFLLIHRLCGDDKTLKRAVGGAEHDVIFLEYDEDKLNDVITDEQIVYLLRCGVHYSDEYDGLVMFR